jgi:hypothetical protein
MQRESKEMMEEEEEEEETIYELPKDANGKAILPKDAVVMRMFEILDSQREVDPDTGAERWLEVIRALWMGSSTDRGRRMLPLRQLTECYGC